MKALLKLSEWIDALNNGIGKVVLWLILLAVLVSAGNAVVRYAFNMSSNAFLEAQWYMYSVVFLLMGGYTLLHNRHVRVDVLYARYSPRTKAIVNIIGALFFLLPTAYAVVYFSWGQVLDSWSVREISPDPGGLPRYPIKVIIPIGFALLVLQALSEMIKNAAFLAGQYDMKNEEEEGVA